MHSASAARLHVNLKMGLNRIKIEGARPHKLDYFVQVSRLDNGKARKRHLELAKAPSETVGLPSQARTVVIVACTDAIRTLLFLSVHFLPMRNLIRRNAAQMMCRCSWVPATGHPLRS